MKCDKPALLGFVEHRKDEVKKGLKEVKHSQPFSGIIWHAPASPSALRDGSSQGCSREITVPVAGPLLPFACWVNRSEMVGEGKRRLPLEMLLAVFLLCFVPFLYLLTIFISQKSLPSRAEAAVCISSAEGAAFPGVH